MRYLGATPGMVGYEADAWWVGNNNHLQNEE